MNLDSIFEGASLEWFALFLPTQRIFVGYLGLSLLIAVAVHAYYRFVATGPKPEGVDEKGPAAWIFDPAILFHESSKQDVVWFLVNAVISGGIMAQILLSFHVLVGLFEKAFSLVLPGPLLAPTATTGVLFTLGAALVFDLAVFITHTLQHKVPILWEFHKVHHSAEVLTPITVYRMHPVDLFFTKTVHAIFLAALFAGFLALTGAEPTELKMFSLNVVILAFYVVGYNLRHTHVWLAYPGWLSHVLMSPAQHQIHHSSEEPHWDKNMGFFLSCWDWMAGTLYVPKHYEKLTFGVYNGQGEPLNPFATVTDMYLQPFRRAWDLLIAEDGKRTLRQRKLLGAVVVLTLVAAWGAIKNWDLQESKPDYPSVHVAELTWTEIHHAVEEGYDTLIIPTAGIEQNGPLVVLSKHRHVVRHTSEEIAGQLGHTLVAPVIDHVPEGALDPEPEGHMRYAGTLTVPEAQFEALLEWTARSYREHGFTRFLLVGDSGGNQEAQARVAEKLSAEWAADGLSVEHIGDYYAANGQVEYLLSEGYTEAEIGTHAGIRDTSELMYVHPESVRKHRDAQIVEGAPDQGFNGNAGKASAEIGEKMVALKVEAALKQIRANEETRGLRADLD